MITLPRGLPLLIWNVGDVCGVGRKRGSFAAPHGQGFRDSAVGRDGIQAIEIRVSLASRSEENFLAVGRPTDDDVGRGMPGQPFRFAAVGGHYVSVHVPVILTSKSDPSAIWRESGPSLVPTSG